MILYLLLLFCLILITLLAASEAALAGTNRVRLRHLLRAHTSPEDFHAAQQLSTVLSGDAQQFLATVTVAANIPVMAAAALTLRLAQLKYGSSGSILTALAVMGLAVITVFQITPRLLVSSGGGVESLWWVRPARLLVNLLGGPVGLFLALGRLFVRPLERVWSVMPRQDEEVKVRAGALRDTLEAAHASGMLPEGPELMESIFTFRDTRVHEIMTPRTDIAALPLNATPDELLDLLQETGFSRIPIHEGQIDQVAGIVHVRDVLDRLSRGEVAFGMQEIMRPPLFIPESTRIDEALATMKGGSHLALVIDEFGGTAGLLTIEDILEELVGEIADEHDPVSGEPFTEIDDAHAVVDGTLHLEDLAVQWKLRLRSEQFDTVGGFMLEQLGRAPELGDRVETPDACLVVEEMRGPRPHRISITRYAVHEGEESLPPVTEE